MTRVGGKGWDYIMKGTSKNQAFFVDHTENMVLPDSFAILPHGINCHVGGVKATLGPGCPFLKEGI